MSYIVQNLDPHNKVEASRRPDLSNKSLYLAARKGDVDLVLQCLRANYPDSNPDFKDSASLSLKQAPGNVPNGTWESHTGMYNANVNYPYIQDSVTPLMAAAANGHHQVLRALLDHKADVHMFDDLNQTALHKAAESGWVECVELLLAAKGNSNALDYTCRTPLDLAEIGGAGPDRLDLPSRRLGGGGRGDHKAIVERLRGHRQTRNRVNHTLTSTATVGGRSQRTYTDDRLPDGTRFSSTCGSPRSINRTTGSHRAATLSGRISSTEKLP